MHRRTLLTGLASAGALASTAGCLGYTVERSAAVQRREERLTERAERIETQSAQLTERAARIDNQS